MSDWPLVHSHICTSLPETTSLARDVAQLLRAHDIVALTGTLGAGKTAFARAVIQELADEAEDVPSPTYNLLITYDCPSKDFSIYHYDLYRVEQEDDVLELDIDDAFEEGVSLIEWPDRMGHYLPREHLEIRIEAAETAPNDSRRISFYGNSHWAERLAVLAARHNNA